MTILSDFVDRIIELARPETVTIGDVEYATRLLALRPHAPSDPLAASSLASLVSYLDSNPDELDVEKCTLSVSHTRADVFGPLEDHRLVPREHLATVLAPSRCGNFRHLGTWMPRAEMQIFLASCFEPTEDRADLLELIGSVAGGQQVEHEDDGLRQRVVTHAGIAKLGKEGPKPYWSLKARRTWYEVDQPVSLFLLRIEIDEDEITCGLYDAEGESWKAEAATNARGYLASSGVLATII